MDDFEIELKTEFLVEAEDLLILKLKEGELDEATIVFYGGKLTGVF